MCGILGISGARDLSIEGFERALDLLKHRGPDDRGVSRKLLPGGERLWLGHTRLSILDLSEQGHQPMVSPRTGATIVYNGEVYNFLEIREELEAKGYRFRSNCDTEVILAAYDEWGKDCLQRFNGMFAFCIHDQRSNTLFLSRDRVGIKPLYYFQRGTRFGFSSELHALMALHQCEPELDPKAVAGYFQSSYFPRETTPLKRYFKLLPGHWLLYDLDNHAATIEQYWDPIEIYSRPKFTEDEEELADRLEALLLDSVKKRTISDVPLGAFLSGGIDSSLVVALLCRVQPAGAVKTFSIGVTAPEMDEAPFARKIAHHLGTEHHEEYVTPDNLKDVVWANSHYDEPFADYSSIPTSVISRIIRKDVTVALSGDGGDELHFGYTGYPRWSLFQRFFKLPRALRASIVLGLWLSPVFLHRHWSRTLGACRDVGEFYCHGCTPNGAERIMPAVEVARSDPTALEALRRIPGDDWREIPLAVDLAVKLPGDYLTKVDRASMGNSLEVRVPFLDHRFVEFSAQLPVDMKYRNGSSKYLLKKVLARHVPRELFERPKMGFSVPLGQWFRQDMKNWVAELLTESREWTFDLIDYDGVVDLLARHQRGQIDATYTIWALISWRLWVEKVRLIS